MIRTLGADEPIPGGAPRRYKNGTGYIRLRWRVGTGEYVEEYEHRIVAGRPSADLHVHHIDGDKANNDPSNLLVLTPTEHGELHAEQDRLRYLERFGPRVPRKRKRREARRVEVSLKTQERLAQLTEMYAQGLSTVQIGKLTGIDPSWVHRILRRAGVEQRHKEDYARPIDSAEVIARYQAGQGVGRIKTDLRVDADRVRAVLVEAGIKLRGPGRVPGLPQRGVAS